MKIEFTIDDHSRINEVRSFINEWNNDLDFIESTTSGSTGKPKVIRLLKKHMLASARMTGNFLKLKTNDTALLCMSMSTIAGKMMVVRAIVLDLELIVSDVTSSPLIGIEKKIDFAAMVPLQVQGSLLELGQVNKLIVGGGIISSQLWIDLSVSKVEAYQTFGMTETISHIAMREISLNQSNYQLLPGIDISIVDECLMVNAPSLGVKNLQTKDHISIAPDGTFSWLGRKDFVINSGGIKIHPEELETKIEALVDCAYFVYGLPDNRLGEKLVLCIEGDLALTKTDFAPYLDKFHLPKEIYFYSRFARTDSGKVSRIETIEHIENAKKQVL